MATEEELGDYVEVEVQPEDDIFTGLTEEPESKDATSEEDRKRENTDESPDEDCNCKRPKLTLDESPEISIKCKRQSNIDLADVNSKDVQGTESSRSSPPSSNDWCLGTPSPEVSAVSVTEGTNNCPASIPENLSTSSADKCSAPLNTAPASQKRKCMEYANQEHLNNWKHEAEYLSFPSCKTSWRTNAPRFTQTEHLRAKGIDSFFITASPQALHDYFENPYIENSHHGKESGSNPNSNFDEKHTYSVADKVTKSSTNIFKCEKATNIHVLSSSSKNQSSAKTVFSRIFSEDTTDGSKGANPSDSKSKSSFDLGEPSVNALTSRRCETDNSRVKHVGKGDVSSLDVSELSRLGVSEEVQTILKHMSVVVLSSTQKQVLPLALNGKDLVCVSPSGTGQTICHCVTACNKIMTDRRRDVQVVIVSSSDHSVLHIGHVYNSIAKYGRLRISVYTSLSNVDQNALELRRKEPHIVVSTPQRIDWLITRNSLNLQTVQLFVIEQLQDILNRDSVISHMAAVMRLLPRTCQILAFTTVCVENMTLLQKLSTPKSLAVHKEEEASQLPVRQLKHTAIKIKESEKIRGLIAILDSYEYKKAFVHAATKSSVESIMMVLSEHSFNVTCIIGSEIANTQLVESVEDAKVVIGVEPCQLTRFDLVVLSDQMPFDDEVTKAYMSLASRTGLIGVPGTLVNFVTDGEVGEQLFAVLKLRFDIDVKEVILPT